VYGPPLAGVVTAAGWLGAFRNWFGQKAPAGGTVCDVRIQFRRIAPAAKVPRTWESRRPPVGPRPLIGAVVVTNDTALAAELAGYSPDFTAAREHAVDRALME
jgi:hypothetical protein